MQKVCIWLTNFDTSEKSIKFQEVTYILYLTSVKGELRNPYGLKMKNQKHQLNFQTRFLNFDT